MATAKRANRRGSNPLRRSDGRWQINIGYTDRNGLFRRTSVTATTRRGVLDKAEAMIDRLRNDQPIKDSSATVAEYAYQWIEGPLDASDRKATTKSQYATLTRTHIVGSRLGALELGKVKPSTVLGWIGELKKKNLAQSTIRSAFTILRQILDSAVSDDLIAKNPAEPVRRPKVDRREAAYLSSDQAAALIAAAHSSRYQPLFRLLAGTGLRRGEALALRWVDVDTEHGVLHVRGTLASIDGVLCVTTPKTARSVRRVPTSAGVQAVLRELAERQQRERIEAGSMWEQTGFVFTTEFGQPCDPRNALRALKAAAKKAGLPTAVGLHTLRHTAATTMLTHGVPLTTVSEVLGHESIAVTGDIYSHVAPVVSRAAVDVLDEALMRNCVP